jgi:gamma-glutamyl:cysteine ligase YbdK (ATP-grasp superfamily)
MGLEIDREHFSDADFDCFARRLQQSLSILEKLLDSPDFGRGPCSLGAELEVSIIDARGKPLPINRQVLASEVDTRIQLEVDRFNLEYNLDPVPFRGRPFSRLKAQLSEALNSLDRAAGLHGGQVAAIGILPTLTSDDLQGHVLTDLPRYRALAAGIRRLRKAPFQININGEEQLVTVCDSVTLEGGNTSLQLHLRVSPEHFAGTFNAAQMVTPLALAVAANSPIFLGRRLWDETRIALFKQAVDSRQPGPVEWRRAARVPFGHGWVRTGALEQFAESVLLFPPIIPMCSDTDPDQEYRAGIIPSLHELRLHQSTVWQWNRAIFDPQGGGHLRIEFRSLPAGPTSMDMAANAAFLIGATLGWRDRLSPLLPGFPFQYAEYNFYRAAQHGLDAQLVWPSSTPISPRERSVREIILETLPIAADGLASTGVEDAEIQSMLSIIRDRCTAGLNPARWQSNVLHKYDRKLDRAEALKHMLTDYQRNARSGLILHDWPG